MLVGRVRHREKGLSPVERERNDYVEFLHYPWEKFGFSVQNAIINMTSQAYLRRRVATHPLPRSDFEGRLFYVAVSWNEEGPKVLASAGLKQVQRIRELPMLNSFIEPLRELIIQHLTLTSVGERKAVLLEVGKFAVNQEVSGRTKAELFMRGIGGISELIMAYLRDGHNVVLVADTLTMPEIQEREEGYVIGESDTSMRFFERLVRKVIGDDNVEVDYKKESLKINSRGWYFKGSLHFDDVLVNGEEAWCIEGCIKAWSNLRQRGQLDEEYHNVITFHKAFFRAKK